MKMKVYDKEFEVELLSFEDNSSNGSIFRKVSFTVRGELYHYTYSGGAMMALTAVVKENRETNNCDEVYSSWKHIPDGSYYSEIGRRLSVEHRTLIN
ncbi:MAG: hypothetical protein RBT74_10735 [Tenuifilaceae bacterium]|jgi:hypothetical protein|nr:hypothetical protein [Tenuifilaceae bacterium]